MEYTIYGRDGVFPTRWIKCDSVVTTTDDDDDDDGRRWGQISSLYCERTDLSVGSEEPKMNRYKVRAVIELIRQRGHLPVDDFGNMLSPDEIMVRLALNDVLTPGERMAVRWELVAIMEAQNAIDHIKENMS